MRFSVHKSDILDVLSKVQGLTGRKSSLAITETVLIKTVDSGITLMATDLESGFEGTYPAEIETQGVIAINARKFYEIVRDYPNDNLILKEVDNRWIEIGDEKVFYHIVGMNPDDFPDAPEIEEIAFFEMDSRTLKKMIEKALMIGGGSSDDKRAHIIGVSFERKITGDEKKIRMVSTDGSRLAMVDCRFDAGFELPEGPSILIPKKALNEVNKFLEPIGDVKIGIKDNNLVIKKDAETIIVRLLEGDFPQYSEIIEKEDGHIIALEKGKFLMTLKRMSILSSEDYKAAIFDFSKKKLSISAANPELGESKEDMDIDFEGDNMKIAFNPRFFIDTLNVIDGGTVILFLSGEDRPCLVFDRDDDSFLSAIMPMRV
ncbi:MAG: DNA polymerase III subunit beta [Desulfobacterales bacterium]|jgi:DNA polymerase-3 subunit beta|nr:DNA polymerase III subunit beta [Desulfobacterales bacterium]